MVDNIPENKKNQKFARTIREDWKKVKLKDNIGSEYRDIKEYYLTDERKTKLQKMGALKRFLVIPYWLLKALFFKLTRIRRILLLSAIILILLAGDNKVSSGEFTFQLVGTAVIGGLILLFILALELKDKLTAKTELEEGRAVQRALMPETNPQVSGWDIWLYTQPANDVGGDLLDFIRLKENKFGISIGDVAGKGLSAALMMAKLQSTIRAIVTDFDSLSDFAGKLNRIFCRDSISKIFASLVYLEIKSGTGEIKILNAGHIPPVILSSNNITQLEKDAPALGLLPNAVYQTQNVTLNKNEFIVIYSDGVIAAQNETGEFYGEEKLFKLFKSSDESYSQTLGKLILEDVAEFTGKAVIHDDITIAILKTKSVI